MSTSVSPRELILSRDLPVTPEALWKAWTERLAEWFAPKPLTTELLEFDFRAGGAMRTIMRFPDGTEIPTTGLILEVVEHQRIVMTDAFTAGWQPNPEIFFTAVITFEPLPEGRTRYTVHARHWTEESARKHEAMGFFPGWGQVIDQLAAVAAEGCELHSSRTFDFPRERVFAAFRDPAQLAQWWGPDGFTNTFDEFDFRPEGRWKFTMHGPDGTDYPNENIFREIEEPSRIVLDHVCAPLFRMTATLTEEEGKTTLTWRMTFKDAATCEQLRPICEPANEQNFDRLTAVLNRQP